MVAAAYRRLRGQIETAPPLDLASILSTLLVAFHGFHAWFFKLPSQSLVIIALIFRDILKHPLFWLLLTLLTGTRIVYLWQNVDNHKFVLFYWLCCMTLAHWVKDAETQDKLLIFNSRFFLVFVMLGAVAQKVLSPTYMDSSFFEFELLVDTRFRGFAALFGIDPQVTVQAREFLEALKSPFATVDGNQIFLDPPATLTALAMFVTWYDLIIQVVIGAAFLFARKTSDLIGHLSLLLFIFTAYFAAPVIGFAWTLIVFGVLLAKDRFPNLAMVYIFALVVTTLYKIPWAGWVV